MYRDNEIMVQFCALLQYFSVAAFHRLYYSYSAPSLLTVICKKELFVTEKQIVEKIVYIIIIYVFATPFRHQIVVQSSIVE